MSEISESTISIADEKSDILKKNVLGNSKKWNNKGYLDLVGGIFIISGQTTGVCLLIDIFRNIKYFQNTHPIVSIIFFLIFFDGYSSFLGIVFFIITLRITQRFLKLWSIFAIFNIFMGFACLFYFSNKFTSDPNAVENFQMFKYSLISMPFWFSIYVFANGFGALVLWRISNMKRGYYGDDMYLSYLEFVACLFLISGMTTGGCLLINAFRRIKHVGYDDLVVLILLFFEVYSFLLCLVFLMVTSRITQRFLKLWSILGIFNIFIGFGCLLYFYNHFTTDPNSKEHFQIFKYALLSMPIWWSIYIFANGFGALVLWRISNMKRGYYGDDMYLVIYGGEESSTKKNDGN